jgi:enterochelin esterase family protein
MPWIEAQHPGACALPARALIGLSYTGLAASYVAFRHPALFSTVISQSGSYWSDDEWLTRQYATLEVALPVRFHLDVGQRETQTDVQHKPGVVQRHSQLDAVRRHRDVLLATGHEVHYREFDGAHEFACWRETLPVALSWALPSPGVA